MKTAIAIEVAYTHVCMCAAAVTVNIYIGICLYVESDDMYCYNVYIRYVTMCGYTSLHTLCMYTYIYNVTWVICNCIHATNIKIDREDEALFNQSCKHDAGGSLCAADWSDFFANRNISASYYVRLYRPLSSATFQ